ncbi:MAG: NAD-dependent epimerase/dehydratase family protein, partial [Nitrososphaerales archaeon]
VRGNILNLSDVLSSIREHSSETVVHLASMLTSDCETRPFEAASVNMQGTATVLEACRLSGTVKRFIFTSTSSVYGATGGKGNIDESFPKEPMNVYGALKYGSELYCQNYTRKYGLEYTACRLRVIFGPGQRNDTGAMKIIGVKNLLDDLFAGRESIFVGTADQKLEVTHPKDAAHALALAAQAKTLPSNAYNVMTGSYTFGEIAKAFEKSVPGCRIKFDPSMGRKPSSGGPGTNFGIYDISRADRELAYRPGYTIEKIVEEVVDYERISRDVK